ncbi:hypothetical protein [Natrialba taiwanensis]|uniref:hypothetical protein n=1 Tax=Natrialba taiwanensis TaxID=160846 RepID=UPI00067792D5|nr:hypothetical protein [Natrialba taiwanensis]
MREREHGCGYNRDRDQAGDETPSTTLGVPAGHLRWTQDNHTPLYVSNRLESRARTELVVVPPVRWPLA